MGKATPLQKEREKFLPKTPSVLENIAVLDWQGQGNAQAAAAELQELFPHLKTVSITPKTAEAKTARALKVGVVLSGGQAPGGHNVISGVFDGIKQINPDSKLIGFSGGPKGIMQNKRQEISQELLQPYRNQGGFDIIGSGRDKIETPEQFAAAEKTISELQLDGLVVIGGDDSNTNAALLAEYLQSKGSACTVVGVPKTIDGDLRSKEIEISFGFDTACKIYAEIIGNIARDALSAKKYYYFIKLMGRSASHIALECALQTQPNLALIGEEIEHKQAKLSGITSQIADLICKRAEQGKDYGIILIPEGIVEFVPEFKALISELNHLLAPGSSVEKQWSALSHQNEKEEFIQKQLSESSKQAFSAIPAEIRQQLLLERDPHGNVQVSKIETERLFIETVRQELQARKKAGKYSGKFSAQPHFCGYEGRSGLPTNFDSQYCYSLGLVAASLVNSQKTGYMSCVQNLSKPVAAWQPAGIPLVPLMNIEVRHGKPKPVIKKALVDLGGKMFQHFSKQRQGWELADDYLTPGPIQFYGPPTISEAPPLIVQF